MRRSNGLNNRIEWCFFDLYCVYFNCQYAIYLYFCFILAQVEQRILDALCDGILICVSALLYDVCMLLDYPFGQKLAVVVFAALRDSG